MGFARPRPQEDGSVRYQALIRDVRGKQISVGTFSTEAKADRAWQRAEVKLAEGRLGDPGRGRQRFERYLLDKWLPNHEIELRTLETYTYAINRHVIPYFSGMRMVEIVPGDVREWINSLRAGGVSPYAIRTAYYALSAVFTTALNDQITQLHPCKGVKLPPLPARSIEVITPDQFDELYAQLPQGRWRLLAETDIETGLRWGELTELRPADFRERSRTFHVHRTVVEVTPRFHPTGGRFLVKDYPKDREPRRVKVGRELADKILAHIEDSGLAEHDLLFGMPQLDGKQPPAAASVDLGLTPPNARGHRHHHGTITGYSSGGCRCEHCRAAYARYRAERRAAGKDNPRTPRTVETDGHIARRWYRENIWIPALDRADLGRRITPKDLRHAHASWLLAGGADLQTVKTRLGHSSIRTTEGYLHTLPDTDETALDAFNKIRRQG